MAHIPFHRPARRFPGHVPPGTIEIATPPTEPAQQSSVAKVVQMGMPLLSVFGMMGIFLVMPNVSLTLVIVMGLAMLLMGGGSSVITYISDRDHEREKKLQSARYLEHLEQKSAALVQAEAKQRTALMAVHPGAAQLWRRVASREHLWERRPSDPDFMHARIGLGSAPHALRPHLDLGSNPMVTHRADLLVAAKRVVQRFEQIENVPVTLELARRSSISLIAPPESARAMARTIITQLAVAHAPAEFALVVYCPPEVADEWEWAKWLPHMRDPASRAAPAPQCLMTSSAQTLGILLTAEVQQRRQEKRNREPSSHLLVVIDGYVPRGGVASLPILSELLESGRDDHTTVLTLVDTRASEPERVEERLEYMGDGTAHLQEVHAGAEPEPRRVEVDEVSRDAAESIARALAPIRLRDRAMQTNSGASGAVRLLDLLELPSADAVDPATSWKPRPQLDLLKVPLGARADGEPMVIDLKESAMGGMGPHGLVIGATGSGKSELLRTMVTALAITHPPDILNFVFVDFKGGAAFADLASLPHVAGMITNLQGDLSRVDRMYAALVGEQERRQSAFRAAGNVDGIKEYQALYARHADRMEPVPYLMIVVDEFGELLAARPDFLDLFNAIGRVGRSLGMHLLLSSQRLEEGRLKGLEGHLRYRICLRTFSAQESTTVLGGPDAFNLPSIPGAAYLKVDTTLTRFQTALVSAPYLGQHAVQGEHRGPIVLPFVGVRGEERKAAGAAAPTGDDAPTEMEVAIDRLRENGAAISKPVHQVWLPPLSPNLTLDSVFTMARDAGLPTDGAHPFGMLRAAIGVVDLPAQQRQEPCIIDLSAGAGHLRIAGAAHTGKSTVLRSIVLSLAQTHSPSDVNFYCLDYGGGSLHGLESLPHVGGVFGKQDGDKIRRLMREVHSTIEARETLFRKSRIDSIATFRTQRGEGALPPGDHADIFVVIDNWSGFHAEFEDIELDLVPLLGTALAYGVHFVLTANRWADVRPNIRENIGGRLEMRLNDPNESEALRGASKTLPASTPGRGILIDGTHFQAALPRLDGSAGNTSLAAGVEAAVAEVCARWPGATPAPPIRLLPAHVDLADLPSPLEIGTKGIPIGIEDLQLSPMWVDILGPSPHFLVLGDGESGKTNLLRLWMKQLERQHSPEEVQFLLVDYRRTLLDAAGSPHVRAYAPTDNLAKEYITQLRADLAQRLPTADVTREQLMNRSWWSGPEYVLILDDYDLIVSPSGNPVAPLLDLLPQARDVGLHIMLARRVGGIARTSFEPVFQRLRELAAPGIILNGDPMEGPLIGTQKAANLPPGRGYLVQRGQRTRQVQTAVVEAAG